MTCKLRKLHQKQKQWLLAKSKTAIKRLQKKNKYKLKRKNNIYTGKRSKKERRVFLSVPKIFSITNNPNETLDFFNGVYDIIEKLTFKEEIYFNLYDVNIITVDAIMYLIALIKNTKRLKVLQINCSGNIPQSESARKVIETSGFYNYVSPQYKVENTVNSNINISSGYEADPELVGGICDFVHKNSLLDRIDTKPLFPMIMELMTNTKQHAYSNNDTVKSKWYIFVENSDKQIQFVFLDTGEGIPNTIRRDFFEKIRSMVTNSDAFFISSALKGAFRTETEQGHRGKGFPEIYNRISERSISDFTIVSCCGKCDVEDDGNIHETKLSSGLRGSLFYWKLNKSKKENKI